MKPTLIPFSSVVPAGPSRIRFCRTTPDPAPSRQAPLRGGFAETYDGVVDRFVDAFWEDTPELYLQHRLPLHGFVREKFPRPRFIRRHREWSRRHPQSDPIPRAVHDAVAGTSRAIDIYVRRFVETDFTAPLLDATNSFEEACHIAWIAQEMTTLDFREITGHAFSFRSRDRVFAFCSPVFSWEHGFGRQGLIVIRARRIIGCVVTEAS